MANIAPPSSPTMSVPPAETPPKPPLLTDDVADPPVPPGTIEPATPPATAGIIPDALIPLAHGFCQYVQGLLGKQLDDVGMKMARSVDTTVTEMANFTKGVLASNEHASYQISDALLKVMERGFTITGAPYTATVTATSADGFGLSLTMHKPDVASLVDEIVRLLPWLKGQGFTAAAVDWAA